MNSRRHSMLCLMAGAASLAGPLRALAARPRALSDPLRLGVDDALVDSGLAPALVRGYGRDTGLPVLLLHGPASAMLGAAERGENDLALTNTPEAEAALVAHGLAYDRRPVAGSEFILVGPAPLAQPLAAGHDVALALSRLAQVGAPFLSQPDGSGTHLAEQAAWRAAQIAPAGGWYLQATPGRPLLAQARERNACTLIEHGVWAAQGAKGYVALADADPRLAVEVHVLRSFRAEPPHPGGKLFVGWVSGPKGRALVASHHGYRAVAG